MWPPAVSGGYPPSGRKGFSFSPGAGENVFFDSCLYHFAKRRAPPPKRHRRGRGPFPRGPAAFFINAPAIFKYDAGGRFKHRALPRAAPGEREGRPAGGWLFPGRGEWRPRERSLFFYFALPFRGRYAIIFGGAYRNQPG
jgi:hypothetical protein